jgi:hypothetical protein
MHYERPGRVPETRLPCGHIVTLCEECYRDQQHYNDYLDWCARWERSGVMFAVNNGQVLHARDCTVVRGPDRVTPDDHWDWLEGSKPLTKEQATEWLRQDHERRRCKICGPDVPMPDWVKIGRRWYLADAASSVTVR